MAVFANQFYFSFLQKQATNNSSLQLSSDFFAPLTSLSLLLLLLMLPLLSLTGRPNRVSSGLNKLIFSFPVSQHVYVKADALVLISALLIFQLFFVGIILPVVVATTPDWPVLLLQQLSHFGLLILFVLWMLWLQTKTHSIISAVLVAYSLIFTFWLIQLLQAWPLGQLITNPFNLLGWFSRVNSGWLTAPDLLSYVVLLSTVLYLLFFSRSVNRSSSPTKIFLISITIIALYGTQWIALSKDLTSNLRFSLSPWLAEQIAAIESPISITSYGLQNEERVEIQQRLITPLQQQIDRIQYNPIAQSAPWEERTSQGVLFKFGNQEFWISYPFSEHPQLLLYRALRLLKQRQQSWIVFVEGHQEAEVNRQGQKHLSIVNQLLKQQGNAVYSMNLQSVAAIPDNTALLVIASSRQLWSTHEIELLRNYLQTGGSLLWLRDPDDHDFIELENWLGVYKIPGTLMDPVGYQMGTPHPGVLLIREHVQHPITQSLSSYIAMPWSTALSTTNNSWETAIPVVSHDKTWTEWIPENEQIQWDEDLGELQGRFNLMVVLQRLQGIKDQKVAVIGDSHFLADMAINNYANKAFALNVFNWLLQADDVALPVVFQAHDRHLPVYKINHHSYGWILPFVVPSFLLIIGLSQWLRIRRR